MALKRHTQDHLEDMLLKTHSFSRKKESALEMVLELSSFEES